MQSARTLMVQGTASSVGKSLLVTALCRYFKRQGLSVAPFKSLNMALNAHVTREGLEMARAQAVQAEACGLAPSVEMNPVLLKPEGDRKSQVILLGKAQGSRSARELFQTGLEQGADPRAGAREVVLSSLATLRARHDLVIIEGAGSPAEINLRARDIANMFVARSVQAPVLLAGDIDRGGVFAAFVGTLSLLEPEDRRLVKGFLVNKFRGDVSLLQPGLEWLTEHTQIPVAGVLPHLGRLQIAEEDSLNVDARASARAVQQRLSVCVLRLPRISNHDEFQPLEHEPGVSLSFVEAPEQALAADLLIVPGTKSTVADLAWLRAQGLDHIIRLRAQRGRPVLGICGGCQMLGERIADPHAVESASAFAQGLGLLPLSTEFRPEKRTLQVWARKTERSNWLTERLPADVEIPGYYIHAGITEGAARIWSTRVETRDPHAGQDNRLDGSVSENGAVVGTMVHGLLEHDGLRHALLDTLRMRRGLAAEAGVSWNREAEYDRLADAIAEHCDTKLLRELTM
ncbi:MAG: cobyric acid synthase [Myxococcales bacterium]